MGARERERGRERGGRGEEREREYPFTGHMTQCPLSHCSRMFTCAEIGCSQRPVEVASHSLQQR